MGLITKLVVAGAVGHFLKKHAYVDEENNEDYYEQDEEETYQAKHLTERRNLEQRIEDDRLVQERRRASTICRFVDGISFDQFQQMAKDAAKKVHRIKATDVQGPVIKYTVESKSGFTDWTFSLDFNDYGHITGTYWSSSQNTDSSIQEYIGGLIQGYIASKLNEINESGKTISVQKQFCFYCGKKMPHPDANYCGFCGKKLK